MNLRKEIQHIYLVGAKSLGAYGGYETFVYKLTEYHQNKENIKYHVACKANGDGCIEALGTLDRKEQYTFVICGTAVVNSTIEEELKETASRLGVRIFLAGHRLDIPEINACADVAVIPSVREGFGMTGVEALAAGVPVVGSDVQGIREYVIPGKTGYLCDPYDAHQFADAIEKIVNLPSEERAKMVIACKEKAKEFDISKSIAAMKNIYQEVLCHDGK